MGTLRDGGSADRPSMPRERLRAGRATVDALARHAAATGEVLRSGDSARIKQIYIDLADDLVTSTAVDGSVPLLSFYETAAAVAEGLEATTGLHLDVGCGPYPLASVEVAKRSGRPVVGADIGAGMLALARTTATEAGVSFFGVVADAEALPFAAGSFGSVVCDDTIEHLPDDDAGARELARVTASGGVVALATPNRIRLPVVLKKARDWLLRRRRNAADYFAASSHLREYTWRELEQVVAPCHRVLGRGFVPWSGSWEARLASRFTSTRVGRRYGRVVLLFLTPEG